MEPIIDINNIHKSFGSLHVLKGISLQIMKGEIVSIVGSSGAGKTTLLQIIGTLDKPDEGNIIIENVNIGTLNDKKLSDFRNKQIGFVFQFHHLLPEFNALENVCIPALIAKTPKRKAEEKAKYLLNYLNLSERIDHKPNELSGGEQQRVAICRALINDPAIVLADEPSGNLDSKNARELHELFFKLRAELAQSFIIVTHNMELAGMADRMLTMKDGLFID